MTAWLSPPVKFPVVAAAVAAVFGLPLNALAATSDVVDRSALRVCADPNNLPYSNDRGEGFENKIAEVIAKDLGLPIEYTWFPQTIGFVRQTLAAKRCDLIIGIATTNELMQNTNPYYRSGYVIIHRADLNLDTLDLNDPLFEKLKIGVQPRTPPTTMLAKRRLLGNLKSYRLIVDTRLEKPVRAMIEDIVKGEIDVAFAWGPIAGYWARELDPTLKIKLLPPDRGGPRITYRISMGIRYNEPDWKHRLNDILHENRDEIIRVLLEYGMPLIDEAGALIKPVTMASETTHTGEVPRQPEGYRQTDYRAPVPALLDGARTVDLAELKALLDASNPPVLVDVFPAAKKPDDFGSDKIWREPTRATLPGAHWLANMGFGTLRGGEEDAFRAKLDELSNRGERPIVFFCEPNCWMSWNAAKRALALGFKNVIWYPGGVGSWTATGREVIEIKPWRPSS